MKHYYFKFQEGNTGVKKWIDDGQDSTIPLSIYYGKWKANEKDSFIKNEPSSRKKKQVEIFYSIKNNFAENYFWIFYSDKIFCFKPKTGIVYDGKDDLIVQSGSLPKTMDAERCLELEKRKLPEAFANINSYQKYNRMTIAEFIGPEREIAASLIHKNKIKISHENYLEFLSPVEFETLVFLIFNHGDSFCSSFRGGTLKDFDLKVSLSENFHELLKGDYLIQIKKKPDIKNTNCKVTPNTIFIYLGEENSKDNKFGRRWLTEIIEKRTDIRRWLEKMVFKYDIFNFSW